MSFVLNNALRNRIYMPLKVDERVQMTITQVDEIPPGANPFHYDSYNMGASLTNDILAMFSSTKPTTYLFLNHIPTGQRFQIDVFPEKLIEYGVMVDPVFALDGDVVECVNGEIRVDKTTEYPWITAGDVYCRQFVTHIDKKVSPEARRIIEFVAPCWVEGDRPEFDQIQDHWVRYRNMMIRVDLLANPEEVLKQWDMVTFVSDEGPTVAEIEQLYAETKAVFTRP